MVPGGRDLGMSPRSMSRWRNRFEKFGYEGLAERRCHRPSISRVELAEAEELLRLYRDRYPDFNGVHFPTGLRLLTFSYPSTDRTDHLLLRPVIFTCYGEEKQRRVGRPSAKQARRSRGSKTRRK